MKKLIFSLLALCGFSVVSFAQAQSDGKGIEVQSTRVARTNEGYVTVEFRIEPGENITSPNRSLVIRPVLEGSGRRMPLPVIVVRGRNSEADVERRAMNAAGFDTFGQRVVAAGTPVEYRARVPWQEWMSGSRLILEGLGTGSREATEVEIGVVADNLLANPNTMAESPLPDNPATPPRRTAGTVGDELAARFTFVEPEAGFLSSQGDSPDGVIFDYGMPLVFGTPTRRAGTHAEGYIEMTRNGALEIRFELGGVVIERDLGENNQRLVDLISAVRLLDNAPGCRITRIIVAGFSAPEGDLEEKQTLALERATALKDFLTANSGVDSDMVGVYDGGVDWTTLRGLVANSGMADRYRVLDIIDNVPVQAGGTRNRTGRLARLMALNDGRTFAQMREEFFGQMRQTGAYVKVYYENMR
jgi:hypothetical protein